MVLTGLGLTQALVLFAAAGAIAVALYLLKLRRRQIPVPFLALWEELLGEPSATRLFSRLRHLLSLLLMLIVIALLTAALTDPQRSMASRAVRHSLVLVDAGLTMQATDVAPNRLARALEIARTVVSDAGPTHRMLVAQMDATPLPLGPLSADVDTLTDALARITPTDRTTQPDAGYRFALQALRGRARPGVVVISDRADLPRGDLASELEAAGIEVTIARVGAQGANFAITELAIRRYPLDKRRSELLMAVHNAGRTAGKVEVALVGDGTPIAVDTIDLAPGATERRFYDDLGGVDREVEARLTPLDGAHDHLRADDVAHAVVPERRRARVLCVTEGNRYLEAALLLDEYLEVDVIPPPQYATADGYDAVIFDRFAPPVPPGRHAIYLRPGGEGVRPIDVGDDVELPRFERIDRDHPLARWVALTDVNVARTSVLRPAPGDAVIAADARTPLVVAGTRAKHRFVVLGFDVRESDLPLRAAWPLLLLNAIDWLRDDAAQFVGAHAVGEPIRVPVTDAGAQVTATQPNGTRTMLPVVAGEVVTSTAHAGFIRIEDGEATHVVAVQRDAAATGAIAPGPATERWRASATDERGGPELPPWTLLLLVALGVIAVEWLTYHRRWTV